MMSASRRWIARNRTKFAIGVGIVGLGYAATQYVLSKISDARERMSSDRIARENLRRRFEQNQEDCTFTVLALLPTATENILAEMQTERITYELQQQKAAKLARTSDGPSGSNSELLNSEPPSVTDDDGRSMVSLTSESGLHASRMGVSGAQTGDGPQDGGSQAQKARRTKLQLWNDLKISSITRAFTLIYTLALLTLLTRVQLNLLGRRSYLSSVVSLATGPGDSTISLNDDENLGQAYGNEFETNRRYLTFSWWLLHRGWREVMVKVEAAVKDVFGQVNLRDDVTMEKFSEWTIEVRKRIEGATDEERTQSKWLQYLLPPRDQEDFVLRESGMLSATSSEESVSIGSSSPTTLRRLLDETADLIESPPFANVLTRLLDAGFSTLVENKLANQAFGMPPTSEIPSLDAPRVTEVVDAKPAKLPIIMAVLTKQAHSIGNGVPNEYLQAMDQVANLEAFAAVVYSNNLEREVSPMDDQAAGPESDAPAEIAAAEINTGDVHAPADLGAAEYLDVGTASTFEDVWGKASEGKEEA